MTDLTRPLSVETLRARGACERAQALFRERWGDSVEVTEARCVSVADLFDWDWAAQKLLSPAARAEYRRAGAPASDEYRRACAPALAAYESVRAAALAAYESVRPGAARACASAWAEYKRVCAAARAEYERARVAASDKYGRVRATAWARLYVSDRESPA